MKKKQWMTGLSSVLTAAMTAAGPFDSWNYRMQVAFPGYNPPGGATTLTNFPALVVLSTNINGFSYGQFQSLTNQDLRFTAADGTTELNYEIDQWNSNGTSYVWVQVPNLVDSNSYVYAHWGMSSVTAPAYTTNGATWNGTYLAVWHMNQANAQDSTLHGYNGTGNGITNAAGEIGTAQGFDGVLNRVITLGSGLSTPISSNITVESWVYALDSSASAWRGIITERYSGDLNVQYELFASDGNLGGGFYDGDWHQITAGSSLPLNQWIHAASTYDGNTIRLYANGVQVATPLSGLSRNLPMGANGWFIGQRHDASSNADTWRGSIDEVRVANVTRGSNWLWACYANMASNGVFNTYGPASLQDQNLPQISVSAATNVTQTSAFLNATLASNGTSAASVWVYWGATSGGTNAANWANTNAFGVNGATPPVPYTFQATGFTAGSNYVYRYYAQNASGGTWTPDQPFTTLVAPSVQNLGAINILPTTATLQGQVTVGNPLPLAYTCWGLADGGNSSTSGWQNVAAAGAQAGAFSVHIGGLTPATTYYYRGYVTNSEGSGWANATTSFVALASITYTFANNNANWSLASSWTPAGGPPATMYDYGIVPSGKTAVADADLGTPGNRPTIRVDAGGQLNQSAGDLSAPLALNAGLLHLLGFMNNASPINMLADSTIQSDVQCCDWKSIGGNVTGPGKLTFIRNGAPSRELAFSGNNSFSGGIEFRGQGSSSALVQLYANSLSTNGSGATPNTVLFSTNAYVAFYCYPGGFGIVRDLTLNGGSLGLEHAGFTLNGTLSLMADSTLFTAGYTGGGGFTVNGPVVGNCALTCQSDWTAIIFTTDSPNWTGVTTVSGTQGTRITGPGAQGRGPWRVANGATLMFDASPDQDWFVTNDLASVSGFTNAVIQVEGGSATKTLTMCGRTLAPGGTNNVGMLTINGRLRLASDGAQRATLAIAINGTNIYNGANATNSYGQLKVAGNGVDLGGQNLGVSLGCNPSSADVFYILLNNGANAISNTFYNLPEGGRFTCTATNGRPYAAKISYAGNGDGGSLANDVMLFNFRRADSGSVLLFQ